MKICCDACRTEIKITVTTPTLLKNALPRGWRPRRIDGRVYVLCDICGNLRQFVGGLSPYLQDRLGLAAFGAYFTLHLWRHVNQVFLLGLGEVNFAVRIVAVESLAVLTAAAVVLHLGIGLAGVYLAIAACLAGISAWIYPLKLRSHMRKLEDQAVREPKGETGAPVSHGLPSAARTKVAADPVG